MKLTKGIWIKLAKALMPLIRMAVELAFEHAKSTPTPVDDVVAKTALAGLDAVDIILRSA